MLNICNKLTERYMRMFLVGAYASGAKEHCDSNAKDKHLMH